ncbi:MAG: hypothetical protein EAX95_05355 [Candidatus Thorarchaeota archaeon]|nr:hypothetical protein [Candidatus Thorarchaeota archaeon]
MSNKNASFGALVEDLKVSFKFAAKNLISFLLGTIGVLLVSVVIFILIALAVFIPMLILLGGWEGLTIYFTNLGPVLEDVFTSGTIMNPAAFGAMAFVVAIIASPFFIAIGALFGMGREIVESEGTTAEGVFVWYKKEFFSLAGTGILLLLIVLLPALTLYGAAFAVTGFELPTFLNSVIAAISVLWLTISLGLSSMVFPAVIDGLSVIDAFKESFRLSIKHFDRVFALWLAFLGMLAICIVPPAVGFLILGEPGAAIIGIMVLPLAIFLLLLYFPALVIASNRLYLILSGIEVAVQEPSDPDLSFIGGV